MLWYESYSDCGQRCYCSSTVSADDSQRATTTGGVVLEGSACRSKSAGLQSWLPQAAHHTCHQLATECALAVLTAMVGDGLVHCQTQLWHVLHKRGRPEQKVSALLLHQEHVQGMRSAGV